VTLSDPSESLHACYISTGEYVEGAELYLSHTGSVPQKGQSHAGGFHTEAESLQKLSIICIESKFFWENGNIVREACCVNICPGSLREHAVRCMYYRSIYVGCEAGIFLRRDSDTKELVPFQCSNELSNFETTMVM
jgi:hypothetical protein